MLQLEFNGWHQRFIFKEEPLTLKIYAGKLPVPEGFNTQLISLEAHELSPLDWKGALVKAKKAQEQGLLLLWELELGLLEGALDEESRFLTLQLALHHFIDMIWPAFQKDTIGLIFYRGAISDSEQGCALLAYLQILTASLPEEVAAFVFFDTRQFARPQEVLTVLTSEHLSTLFVGLRGPWIDKYPYGRPLLAWEEGSSPLGFLASQKQEVLPSRLLPHALCLSGKASVQESMKALREVEMTLATTAFQILTEGHLRDSWEGVDILFLSKESLGEVAIRALEGFLAAGGTAINLPNALGGSRQ